MGWVGRVLTGIEWLVKVLEGHWMGWKGFEWVENVLENYICCVYWEGPGRSQGGLEEFCRA